MTGMGDIAGLRPPGAAFGAKGFVMRGIFIEVAFSVGATSGRPVSRAKYDWLTNWTDLGDFS